MDVRPRCLRQKKAQSQKRHGVTDKIKPKKHSAPVSIPSRDLPALVFFRPIAQNRCLPLRNAFAAPSFATHSPPLPSQRIRRPFLRNAFAAPSFATHSPPLPSQRIRRPSLRNAFAAPSFATHSPPLPSQRIRRPFLRNAFAAPPFATHSPPLPSQRIRCTPLCNDAHTHTPVLFSQG
jgi:hypothetical protein